ncbi:MAG TPA: methyl-accepting chemotaxis protein [Xanthobacteraceae bacterium]|nr:methyl-accepting chemotaxis protein [Xanthobacteraceae bacterium]
MSIRYKLIIAFGIVLCFAAGAAFYGISAVSNAGDLVVRLYDEPFIAVSYARAAQVRFGDARAAMVRGLTSHDAQTDVGLIEAAVTDVKEELGIVGERMAHAGTKDKTKKAIEMVDAWYQAGLKIVKPGAGGVTALPWSATIVRQSEAVAETLDEIVESASAYGFKFRDSAGEEVAAARLNLILLTAATTVTGILMSIGIAYSFSRPIRYAMMIAERIAGGNLSEEISTQRRDELGRLIVSLGAMQGALRSQADFERQAMEGKDRAEANRRAAEVKAEAEKRAAQVKSEADRKAAVLKLADEFEAAVGGIIEAVSSTSTQLEASARSLANTASVTQQLSATVAGASEEASANVSSVAAATEEMSSSIGDIGRQVQESSKIAVDAVKQAQQTDVRINELSTAASRIGDVVKLITAIAEQTNLLALNATIEAARAGEAGRGFAVVAQEVKTLATQTAKATDEISTQIAGMQTATQESVAAIKAIGYTIERISQISAGIAAAVEAQGAATGEISRSIGEAARGTAEVATNITDVNRGASETGSASTQVLSSAQSLANESNHLKTEVGKFLRSVRIA